MSEFAASIAGRIRTGLRPFACLLETDLVQLASITMLVILYAIVFRESRGLGGGVFTSSWMLLAALNGTWGKLMLSLSVATCIVLWNTKWMLGNCRGFPDARTLVFPVIFVLAWSFSVYEYNFVLHRAHLADRAGIVVLAILSAWRPMFLGLFVTQLGVVIGHLSFPLPLSWTDKSPLIDVLLLSQIYIIGARLRWWRANHFLWGVLWIVAVHYLRPGFGKLELGWLQKNELENLVMGAIHQNGWLCFGLDNDQRTQVVCWVALLSPFMMLAALLVELLPLLYLFSRKILLIGLSGAIGMHLAIFASSGIFFWKWIVLDVALIGAVLQMPAYTARRLFCTRHQAVFCLFLVLGCIGYATAPKLAWWDAPLCQHYHIEVVGSSGRIFQVPAGEMAPFDLQFAQGRLFFADSDPMVVDCLGSCARFQVVKLAETIHSEVDLKRVQSAIGQKKYDAQLTLLLRRLLVNYVQPHSNDRVVPVFGILPDPPQHIWSFPVEPMQQDIWGWQEPAKEIRIRKFTVSHRDGKTIPIQEKTVMKIKVE